MVASHSGLCQKFVVGRSLQGRDLVGIRLTDLSVKTPKPEVKLVGNMHGDETVGRQLLVRLLQDIVLANRTDVLRAVDLYILPSMNPDGFALGRRNNANGLDLNRNFPDRFQWSTGAQQPETQAVMQWSSGRNFVKPRKRKKKSRILTIAGFVGQSSRRRSGGQLSVGRQPAAPVRPVRSKRKERKEEELISDDQVHGLSRRRSVSDAGAVVRERARQDAGEPRVSRRHHQRSRVVHSVRRHAGLELHQHQRSGDHRRGLVRQVSAGLAARHVLERQQGLPVSFWFSFSLL